MPNMSVAMVLSLADSASPQIRSFIGLLERLEVVAKSVSQAMAGIGSIGGAGIGGGGGITEANVQSWGRMVSMAEQMNARIDQMKGKIQSAAQSMDQTMTQAMGRTAAAAEQQFQRVMQGRAGARNQAEAEGVRRNALAGAGFAGAYGASTQELAAMERQLHATRVPADGLNQSFVGIGDTIKGLAAIWAALKIEEGLKASIHAAADFQTEMFKMRASGVSPEVAATQEAAAFRDSSRVPFASPLEALRMRAAAMAGTAERGETARSQVLLDQLVPSMLAATNALRVMGDKADSTQIGRNLSSLFEERGITTNLGRMQQTLDLVVNTFAVTQGKVTPTDWDIFARRFGSGISQISDEGMRNMAAFMNQFKVMGGEAGGGVGGGASSLATAMKQLEAMALGKPIVGQARNMWIESGAFTGVPGQKGLTAREPDLIAKDPIGFFEKYAPNIIAYTQRYLKQFYGSKDPNDPENQAFAMQKFLAMTGITVTTQQAAMLAMNPATSDRMRAQAEQIRTAPGVKGINDLAKETFAQNVINFNAAWEKLAQTLGASVLPQVTAVIKAITSMMQALADFNRANPAAAQIEVIGSVLFGLAAAIIAVQKLLGPFNVGIAAAFTGMGAAATAGGVAAEAATVGLFARLAGIAKAGLGLIAAAFIGWDIGKLILGTDFGKRVEETLSRVFDLMGRGGLTQANIAAVRKAASGETTVGPNVASPGEIANFRRSERLDINADLEDERRKRVMKRLAFPLGDPIGAKEKGGSGGGYNADADQEHQQFLREQQFLADDLRVLDAMFKAGNLSISNFYDNRAGAIESGVRGEIEALEKERAALLAAKKLNEPALARVDTKIDETKDKLNALLEENELKRQAALNDLKRKTLDLDSQGLAASGRRHQAELQRLRDHIDNEFSPAQLAEDPSLQGRVNEYREKASAALQFNQQMERVVQLKQDERLEDEKINNEVAAGQRTDASAQDAKYANHLKYAQLLQAELDLLTQLAQTSGDPKLINSVKELGVAIDGTLKALPPVAQEIKSSLGGAFGSFFSGVAQNTSKVKDLFKKLYRDIIGIFSDRAGKNIADALMNWLFGSGQGGAAGGGGGLGGILQKMFGGGGGGGFSFGSAGGGGGWGGFTPGGANADWDVSGFALGGANGGWDVPGFAMGIDYVPKNMLALIHEGERVVPKHQNVGGMGNVSQQFVISGPIDTRSQSQIASAAFDGVMKARRIR